jgi:hypothetical protein
MVFIECRSHKKTMYVFLGRVENFGCVWDPTFPWKSLRKVSLVYFCSAETISEHCLSCARWSLSLRFSSSMLDMGANDLLRSARRSSTAAFPLSTEPSPAVPTPPGRVPSSPFASFSGMGGPPEPTIFTDTHQKNNTNTPTPHKSTAQFDKKSTDTKKLDPVYATRWFFYS